jgi:membrane-associated PAP2 superfamily phosphatase
VPEISSPQNDGLASATASGERWSAPRLALALILAVGVVTALVFGLYPQLDHTISALFYDPLRHTWPATNNALLGIHRNLSAYLAAILVIIAIVSGVIGVIRRGAPGLMSLRAAWFLIGSCLLGPGLIANAVFKPEWGRPRPADVIAFGGRLPFVPWWNPFGHCRSNCSFVSGETSLAFWILAWAIVVPPRYRTATAIAALVNCMVLGADRIAMGSHFTSDVLFGAIVSALAVWLSYVAAFGDLAFRRGRNLSIR